MSFFNLFSPKKTTVVEQTATKPDAMSVKQPKFTIARQEWFRVSSHQIAVIADWYPNERDPKIEAMRALCVVDFINDRDDLTDENKQTLLNAITKIKSTKRDIGVCSIAAEDGSNSVWMIYRPLSDASDSDHDSVYKSLAEQFTYLHGPEKLLAALSTFDQYRSKILTSPNFTEKGLGSIIILRDQNYEQKVVSDNPYVDTNHRECIFPLILGSWRYNDHDENLALRGAECTSRLREMLRTCRPEKLFDIPEYLFWKAELSGPRKKEMWLSFNTSSVEDLVAGRIYLCKRRGEFGEYKQYFGYFELLPDGSIGDIHQVSDTDEDTTPISDQIQDYLEQFDRLRSPDQKAGIDAGLLNDVALKGLSIIVKYQAETDPTMDTWLSYKQTLVDLLLCSDLYRSTRASLRDKLR